jgi:S-formylglutathione hydrolase
LLEKTKTMILELELDSISTLPELHGAPTIECTIMLSRNFLLSFRSSFLSAIRKQVTSTSFSLTVIAKRLSLVMGHSMGGHGALICFLKNPGLYKSVSAFSPICNPVKCPWGVKAFTGYLGEDQKTWEEYDATLLIANSSGKDMTSEILIDQGGMDGFLKDGQLLPENFLAAARAVDAPVTYRLHAHYDHSYYFISTYIDDHIQHHAYYLSRG